MYRRSYRPSHGRGRRGPDVYATLLLFRLLDSIAKLEHKPPLTVSLIAINLCIFYLPQLSSQFPQIRPLLSYVRPWTDPRRVCLIPRAVLQGNHWRLLVPAFIHASDTHVIYNCASFLYKGITLESHLGSLHMLFLVLYLAISSNCLYVLIALSFSKLGLSSSMLSNCVVGFSGVIFGLKTIINSSPRYDVSAERIFGWRYPRSVSPWTELVLASVMMPNVSFFGHLCGILAALIYLHVPRLFGTVRNRIAWRSRQAFVGQPRFARLHYD